METKYYLPIGSTSLAHYFGGACIKPSKYFNNKPEDLQDKFNDFLLVTTKFGTRQTDCCLELVFTKQEINDLIDIKDGFYLYEKPLPITRIKKIYFTSKERKEQTITNINMSTAFVPDELVMVIDKGFDDIQTDKLEKPQDIHINSYEKEINTFNGSLGGLALMRLAGEEYMNYSENYFATLSLFNSVIQRDLEASKVSIDTRYCGVFTGDGGFQKIIPYLNKTIDETDIDRIAKEEKQTVRKEAISKIIDLNSLDKWTYTVAVLNTYGVGSESKKKKVDELILSNFKSNIKQGKSEGIALCYGINRGYSAFSNKYCLNQSEKVVKFQLNSQLDYYTIESLYQYVFNKVKSDDFPYLKEWCPKQKLSEISKKTDYKILDVIVIGKKKAKVLSKEYWANLLPSFLQSNKFTEKTLPQIYQELGEVVFNDAKDEIAEDYENQIAQKQEEIEKLKIELQSKKTISVTDEYKQQQEEQTTSMVVESTISYSPKQDIKKIVEQVFGYQSKTMNMLKKEAKDRGISTEGKKDDIIMNLLITPNNRIDFNE